MRISCLCVVALCGLGCGEPRLGAPDSGGRADAGARSEDAASAGSDAALLEGRDASVSDAGARPVDAAVAFAPDAAQVNAPDAGSSGASDVWMEIDYGSAYTPTSPAWSFSATPGFASAQWATTGKTGPEAWDRFNDMSVEDDPIGRALIIGPSGQLQVMFGLLTLASYDHMSVQLEGRSCDTSSSVSFEVTNPLNGCGASGSMDQDWTIDLVDLDLQSCAVAGAGVQAVRVAPTGGSSSIALVRLRVTLFGASW